MSKFLKGACGACGGHIEFPAEAVGTTVDCPHCGKPTELLLAAPPQSSSVPVKTMVFSAIAIVILVGGLVGAIIAVKPAKRLVEEHRKSLLRTNASNPSVSRPANPFAGAGFSASAVTVEKAQGSALVYATGTIRNITKRQRFGVKVELELLDAAGKKIGDAKDYQAVIEPNAEWRFRAQVLEKKTAAARIVSINEDH